MSNDDDFTPFTVKLTDDYYDKYEEFASTKSGTARMILSSWVDVVEEHGLKEEPEAMQLAMLYMYKNAFEKHIESMKMQRDKVEEAIDAIEDEDDSEVILEVDLKLKPKHL